MIIFFLLSILFLLWVGKVKKINIFSIYGAFGFFSLLYNIVPFWNLYFGIEFYSLSFRADLLNIQFLLVSISNIFFGTIFLFFYKEVKFNLLDRREYKKSYKVFYVLLFLITLLMAFNYGWHVSKGVGSGLFIVTAYLKLIFVSSYLYYIYKYGIDRWLFFMLLLQAILAFIDGARTTFLPIVFLTLFLFSSTSTKVNFSQSKIITYFTAILLFLSLSRALVMNPDELLWTNMLMSLLIEACIGSYMSLQSIYSVGYHQDLLVTFGGSYILDPFIWMIPQGDVRDSLLIFNAWINDISPFLNESFAPMGGFYYIAEALSAFSFIGPPIVTILFAFITIWFEKNKNNYKLLYLSYFSTIGFLFSKNIFANSFKLFIYILLFTTCFYIAGRMLKYFGGYIFIKKNIVNNGLSAVF